MTKKRQAQMSFSSLSTLVWYHVPLTQVRHCCSSNTHRITNIAQWEEGRKEKKGHLAAAASQALPASWGRILSWNCYVSRLPPIPAKKNMGRKEGGPTRCISIHWKSVRVRVREREKRRRRRRRRGRGVPLPTNVEEPNQCVQLIREWLPLESTVDTQAQITGNTGNVYSE